MHQVCGGVGDGKVVCETLADDAGRPVAPPPQGAAAEDSDFPAESFRVRIGEEIDWTDVNVVYDRDDSTKGNTNPKSQHANGKPPRSNSQRFSGNLTTKAPILGLPNKIQHSGYLGRSARRPTNGRIFPKKKPPGGGRKSAVPEEEPGSPKVSCFGKVLSERERERCRQQCRQSAAAAADGEARNSGCWASLAAMFRCCGGVQRAEAVECVESSASPPSRAGPAKGKGLPRPEMAAPAPGLGGVTRFSSGRRSESWGGDLDFEAEGGEHVAWSGPLNREGMRARRSVGSLEDAERDRDWESEGSASV